MNYRPLNINEQERQAIVVALEGLIKSEEFHIKNSYCGKVGRDLIEHILFKLTPNKQ